MTEMTWEVVETCPNCGCENIFTNWDTSVSGYIATCWQCGKKIFLCDECLHSDDNPHMECDWHEVVRVCGIRTVKTHRSCKRGLIKEGE